jgi:hypothetical protein
MSNAPFPKWVYDITMELLHVKNNGLVLDLENLLAAIPGGMKLAAQGILDYHQLMNDIHGNTPDPAFAGGPAPATADPARPAGDPVTPVVPLQQFAANGVPSQSAP